MQLRILVSACINWCLILTHASASSMTSSSRPAMCRDSSQALDLFHVGSRHSAQAVLIHDGADLLCKVVCF